MPEDEEKDGVTKIENETYCRLCAEVTPEEDLIQHDSEEAMSINVVEKCAEINIDLSKNNGMPRAVCFACFDMLRRTSIFIQNTRDAQTKLEAIFSSNMAVDVKEDSLDQELPKMEVKIEDIELDTAVTDIVEVKKERVSEEFCQDVAVFADSDSDRPLTAIARKKKKKKKKSKLVIDVKEEVELPLDILPDHDIAWDTKDCVAWTDLEWRCPTCDETCRGIESLRVHSIEVHSTCCRFKCPTCDRAVSQYKPMLRHMRQHHKLLKRRCEVCDLACPTPELMRQHRLSEHLDLKRYCKACGATFSTQHQVDEHAKQYSNKKFSAEKIDKLKCPDCPREFKQKANLQSHYKNIHQERSRNFTCHICGKLFYTNGTLCTHIQTHEETKPYKCAFCPLAFKAKGNLMSHSSLHLGVKPFVCEQCGKSFRVKRHLKSHLIIHTDLMPFSCEYCGKSFRFKTRLNLHLRQHTGARPYSCTICMRDFTNGSNYKKHMKRRHNVDTSKRVKFSTGMVAVDSKNAVEKVEVAAS